MTRERMIDEAVRCIAMWNDESCGLPHGHTISTWAGDGPRPVHIRRIRTEFKCLAKMHAMTTELDDEIIQTFAAAAQQETRP